MPYIPHVLPPKSWFAGRTFLVEAKKFIDGVNEKPDTFYFSSYVKSEEMILRGIRSVLYLPATHEMGTLEDDLKVFRELVSPESYAELQRLEESVSCFEYAWGRECVYKMTSDGSVSCNEHERSAAVQERM